MPAGAVSTRLQEGNTHLSRFTQSEADKFASDYEVLAQCRNDPRLASGAGFSGTLFRNRSTGELTLSFRSTEFVDDAVRDTLATGKLEIKELGWAFGQIAEMEQWYSELRSNPNLLAGKNFSVTGYSLGGHLATAFNILRREEAQASGSANPIVATYAFNGAGVGAVVNGRRLTDVVSDFVRFRDDPNLTSSAEWASLPLETRNQIFNQAVSRVGSIEEERTRLHTLQATFAFGARPPAGVQGGTQYQIAALLAARDTVGASYFPLPGGTNWIPISPVFADAAQRFSNMTEVVGNERGVPGGTELAASFVSNSGVHYGVRQEIYIENQPLFRGAFSTELIAARNLLVDNPDANNFADTHSLVLLLDSLSLMAAIETVDPNVSPETARQVLSAISSASASSGIFTQGKAEGDVLERALDALRKLFQGPGQLPVVDYQSTLAGNTWHAAELRVPYESAIASLRTAIASAQGPRTYLSLTQSSASELITRGQAANGVAYRYALKELNPFAILGPDALYALHNASELNLYDPTSTDRGGMTGEYIADRAPFLYWKNVAFTNNVTTVQNGLDPQSWRYIELPQNLTIGVAGGGSGSASPQASRWAVFGGDGSEAVIGGTRADRLYGGAGTDALDGKASDDYMEGGSGSDVYTYSGQNVLGVTSNDGNDTILDVDGKGVLRYSYRDGVFANPQSTVIAEASLKVNDSTWTSADGKFKYEKMTGAQGTTDLAVTIVGDAGGRLTLKGFLDGDFGIRLRDERIAPQFGALTNSVSGDDNANSLSGTAAADEIFGFGGDDTIGGSGGDDRILAGTGADTVEGGADQDRIYGEAGNDQIGGGLGNDELYGGADRDFVSDSGGTNLIEGGSESDVLYAYGAGKDEIYGNTRVTLASAILTGEAVGSGVKGDWIMAGADGDLVIGGADNDALLGGGGGDTIVGGAGNDDIAGDLGWVTNTLDWTVTRVSNAQGNSLNFGPAAILDASMGGADTIYAGAGEDWVIAGEGDDFIDAGSDDDIVTAGAGSDIVIGAAGSDVLFGDDSDAPASGDGDDYLDGGAGVDYIFGNGGDDILVGGVGDDYLAGGKGKDIYIYAKGDGIDTFKDTPENANDPEASIIVTSGIARSDVKFRTGSLLVDFGGGDAIHFDGFDQVNPSNTPLIGELRFDDGQVMTFADILAQGFDIDGTSAADLVTGTGVVDRIRGLEGNDVLIGLDGDDFLYGGSGSDTLQGGTGNDYLEGGEGFDTLNGEAGDDSYVYDTFDTITDSQGLNRIVFDEGIAPENLSVNSFVISGQPRLLIARPGSVGAGLEIRGASLTSSNFVYSFADGRTLSQTELLQTAYFVPQFITGTTGNDSLNGFAGDDNISGERGNDTISGGGGNDSLNGGENDDTLLGGAGNDQLSGFTGNDTLSGGGGADWLSGGDGVDSYLFGYGDGNDTVSELGADGGVDTVRLADGISLSDVTLTHQPNDDLTITLNATQERLTLLGWYAGEPRVEEIVFGDGAVIGESELEGISVAPISGTAADDILGGTPYEDTLEGFAGDDLLDGGPNRAPSGYLQSNDLLLGGEGHDTYVLGWRNARDTVIEQPGETSTIRLAPGMTLDDVVARREGGDLFVHGRRTEHGLLLKNYYVQAHDWRIETALGLSMSMPEFLARPAPTTGDPMRDLWEARKTEFKHEWYAINGGELQEDGSFYQAPSATVSLFFGRTYDNGDWANGTGGLQAAPVYGSERTNSFGAGNVVSSDTGSQHYRLGNESGTTTRIPASYAIDWNSPAISRTTTYLGTYVGFDLLIHSLYRTHASVTLSGAVEGITLDAADGASGPDLVAAVASGALPRTVNGVFDSSTGSFRPVEVLGGPSNNVIALTDFGMVDGGAGNDIIDSVGGGWFSHPAGGNFLYGGAGNDGITGSGDGDLISGGLGDDRLAGWAGDDTFYFFAEDTGVDIVNEVTWYLWDTYDGAVRATSLYNADSGRDSEDTVEFGDGISLDGLTLSWGTYDSRYAWWSPLPLKTYETLDIYWGPGRGVQVLLPDRFDAQVRRDITLQSPGSSWGIERFKFADGTLLSFQDMADRIPKQMLNGTAGDDFLEGGAGNNEFFGGSGIDDLYGAFASDTYHFNVGDGEDWISDPGGKDRIVFGAGITPDMLSLGLGSMLVRVGNGGDALHIEYFDPNDPFGTGAIETYEFADGATLTHAQLLERGFDVYGTDAAQTLTGTGVTDRIYGLGGDDTLVGGAGSDEIEGGEGNDLLIGGEGSDTYRFHLGSGLDTVEETDAQGDDTDSVLLGPGISGENLNVARAGADIVMTVSGGADRLTVRDWVIAPGYRIERAQFADGTVWDAAMLEWLAFLSNRAPQLVVQISDQTAHEDSQFFFAVPADTFGDPDMGDALAYSASRADGTPPPAWLAFNSSTRTFSGRPAQSDVGSVDVRIVATDLWGASAHEMFELSILNTNDAPVLAHAIADQAAAAGALFSLTLATDTFFDPDPGDTLALSAARVDAAAPPPPRIPRGLPPPPSEGGSALPAWLLFDASTRTFSGTPTNDDVGTVEIRVTATDAAGASVSDVFAVTVAPGNRVPVVENPLPDQEAIEDSPFGFSIPATAITDPDAGDTLTWSASGASGEALPGWLIFDALDRVFTGTPANDDVGSFSVRVTATDSSDAAASDVFDITVKNTNDAPTLEQPIADKWVNEDDLFTLKLTSEMFVDVDAGDTLTLSATLPAWLTLYGNVLSGTPLNADVGEFHVKLIATDSAGASVSDEFYLTVVNINDAPIVADAIADQSFEADATFTFTVPAGTFVDEDAGDLLSYSASAFGGGALPSWLTFDAATATFRGNPVIVDIGISHIAVSATDTSGASVVSDFGLIVRAPAGAKVTGSAGGDLIYGGTGDETLVGKAGDDMLFGDVGDDVLRGGTGVDVLQGGEGSDVLHGGTGNNVLDGGSGDDLIFDGSGDSFISGGAGNDTIKMGTGKDVIAFNSGDGWDTIIGGGDGGNTLSFGGGIRYSDLSFSKLGDDLIVTSGQNEGIVLNDWYAGSKSVLNLQIILDATDEFDAGSTDPLYNRRVQTFDFLGLVGAFDQARMASPGLTSWDITNALLQWQLWGADDAALGGDLAYWYGRNRGLTGISLQAAQQVIGAAGFGSDAQSLCPFAGLQEGFVKLS